MDKINVLIAEDHTLFRKGVRKMLEAEEDMKVAGEAATGREALEQARALMPDPSTSSGRAPSAGSEPALSAAKGQALDGVEAARTLHREMPHVGIILVTMFQGDEFVFKGLQAGGRGYILKDAQGDHDHDQWQVRGGSQGEAGRPGHPHPL